MTDVDFTVILILDYDKKEENMIKKDYVISICAYVFITLIPVFVFLGCVCELKRAQDENEQTNVEINDFNSAGFDGEIEQVITVYITKTGSCYHIDDCAYAKNASKILTLDQAESRGYRPCYYCC